jgi:hypothetical protein
MIPGENLRIATDLFGKINAEQIVKGRPEIETVAKSTVVTSGSLLDLRIGDKEVSTKTFLNIFGYPEKVVVRYGDDELTITWSPVGKGTVTERCESSRKAV